MALGRLALLWGLHWAACVLVVAGGESAWLDLSCHSGPTDVVLVPGQAAILYCDQGNMNMSTNITWWKDGEELNAEDLAVLPNGSLLISQGAVLNIEGSYFCTVQNSFGVMRGRTGTIRLSGLPSFHLHPKPQVVFQNSLVRFECSINGLPPPQITWQRDKSLLPDNKRFITLPSGVLQISGVQQEDSGLYRCVASNPLGTRYSDEAQLSVEKDWELSDELTVIRAPQNLTVQAGQSAVMECLVDGDVTPLISWSRLDGSPIPFDIIRVGDANLLIEQAQAHHAGVYVCRASKPHSQRSVAILAQLRVLVPPVITLPPETIIRARAGTARFVCRAEGDPEPTITWLKNGKACSSNGRMRIQPRGSLVITQIALEDAGYYQCVAESIMGSICATAKLLVTVQEGLPGPPQALQALAISSKTVTVAWERPKTNWERVIGFSLHYTKTGDSDNMEYQFAVNNDTTELTVKYLEPGTSYTFYVVAYSQQGASRASQPIVVQTWDDVPGAAPMLSLSSDTPEDLLVKWLPLQPEMSNGLITKYRIEYCTQRDGVVTTVEVDGNETQVTLSSLQPNTAYRVRISASTSAGYGVPSNWLLHRTIERVNQSQVNQALVQLKVIAHLDSLFVSWQLPHTDLLVTGYKLYYRMVCPPLDPATSCPFKGENDWDMGPIKLKKKRKQYEITDLLPGHLYQVKLVTYKKKQEDQTVMWEGRTKQILTTPPELIAQKIPPLPPSHIQVEPNSSTSVWVRWRKPIVSGKIMNYTVRCGPRGAKDASFFTYHSSVSEEILITGLKPYTRYEFAVQTNAAGVDGPYNNIVEKMTLPDRPSSPPADLVLQPLSQFSVQVHWRPPVESNGIIVQYLILYTANRSHPNEMWILLTKEGSVFSTEVENLQSGTKYYFKMGAKTVAGWGPYSSVVEVETLPPRPPDVLDMNSVTGIIVGVCLCLLCLLLCMCASFQQGKQRDVGSELGARASRGPSSYQRARQGSCSQTHCQDSHELETLMPSRPEDIPTLPVPEVTELIGGHGMVANLPPEDKNPLKLKVDVGRNNRNPSQNQVEADVIVHSDFSASERSGRCAGLDSEEEEELSLDQDKNANESVTPNSNPHTQSTVAENENQDWSDQPIMAISTEQSLNVKATKSQQLANGIHRSVDSQENQPVMDSPFAVGDEDPCLEEIAQQEPPLSNTPVLLHPMNPEKLVH